MRGPRYSPGVRRLRRRAIAASVGMTIASVMAFCAIEYFARFVLKLGSVYDPILMLGMILPMGCLIAGVTYLSLRASTRYTSALLLAIEEVAGGRFGTRLDAAKAGIYEEVYENFNAMCGELEKLQGLRDEFINNFSHEFKTPISAINGFARLLLDEEATPEQRREYLEIIASESERLADMSMSALLITKLDTEQGIVERAPYSLDEQIRECAIVLSPQWNKKQIDLTAELSPAVFNGNAELMRHVWLNILGNAIKFTPNYGEIGISLRESKGRLAVAISDTGKGMAKEEIERIFEKYYQGDPAASKGLGLGLAIARRIVELSGGQIEVTSAPGEGSTFTVNLPASK
jgi:signal transduction histidine kinase